jgi:predicted transcriptional regulator
METSIHPRKRGYPIRTAKKMPCDVDNFQEKEGNVDNFSKPDKQRVQIYKSVNELHEAGYSNRKIAKILGMSRTTVIKYVHGEFESLCRKEFRSCLNTYHDYIVKSLQSGMSRKDVFLSIIAKGADCKESAAYDYMNKVIGHYGIDISIGKSISADSMQRRKKLQTFDYLTRSDIFRSLWMNIDLSHEHKEYLFNKYPQLYELNICVKEFRKIFSERHMPSLYLFIEKYKGSSIKALSVFAKGLEKDIDAVENAVSSDLSNGFVEGTISKLKMMKRVMYGRCRRELLAAKMMYDDSG